jgi:hypothetical protein
MSDQPPASVAALIAQMHILVAESERCLADAWSEDSERAYWACRRKVAYIDVVLHELEALLGRLPVPQESVIDSIDALRQGAVQVSESHEDDPILRWLWRGKAIAYETVLAMLRRAGVSLPVEPQELAETMRQWANLIRAAQDQQVLFEIADDIDACRKDLAPVEPQEPQS